MRRKKTDIGRLLTVLEGIVAELKHMKDGTDEWCSLDFANVYYISYQESSTRDPALDHITDIGTDQCDLHIKGC